MNVHRKCAGSVEPRWFTLTVCVLLALTAATSRAQQPGRYALADLKALEESFERLAEQVRPSVVAIQTYQVHPRSADEESLVKIPVSRGSGFVIDPAGWIATNRHVLEEANDFAVVLENGQRFDARVVGTDPRSDLAVIRIDAEGLPAVRFADLSMVRIGQWAFAVGNPFGLASRKGQMSVSVGTVSALGRNMTAQLAGRQDLQYYGNLIETSAAINPGNSGGPLFDLEGQVIGIVTAIETTTGAHEGVGFAVPVTAHTRRILELLKNGEQVRYGFLGVTVAEVDPPTSRRVAQRDHAGARIASITHPDGPAASAGLQAGDVILEIDGAGVEDADHLVRLVGFSPVGTKVRVTYLRKQVKRTATVTIGDRYELLGVDVPK